MNEVRQALREATQGHHERVDEVFGRFDLTAPDAYAAFLSAHAAVLPPAEDLIAAIGLWPDWSARTPALMADLRELGVRAPPAVGLAPPSDRASFWGVLYVLEGSRLGGGVLAARVGAGLPRRYLSSRHPPGAWPAFQAALQAARDPHDDAWLDQSIAAARLTFEAFETAAEAYAPGRRPITLA